MTLRSRRANEITFRRYRRVLTNQEIAEAVRRTPVSRRPAIQQSAAVLDTREVTHVLAGRA